MKKTVIFFIFAVAILQGCASVPPYIFPENVLASGKTSDNIFFEFREKLYPHTTHYFLRVMNYSSDTLYFLPNQYEYYLILGPDRRHYLDLEAIKSSDKGFIEIKPSKQYYDIRFNIYEGTVEESEKIIFTAYLLPGSESPALRANGYAEIEKYGQPTLIEANMHSKNITTKEITQDQK